MKRCHHNSHFFRDPVSGELQLLANGEVVREEEISKDLVKRYRPNSL
jgi:predicted transcriptional regulator